MTRDELETVLALIDAHCDDKRTHAEKLKNITYEGYRSMPWNKIEELKYRLVEIFSEDGII